MTQKQYLWPEWTLADKLVKIRQTTGMTQDEWAHKLGISPRQYARFEKGEYRPDMARLVGIAVTAGIDPEWLLSSEDAGQLNDPDFRREPDDQLALFLADAA